MVGVVEDVPAARAVETAAPEPVATLNGEAKAPEGAKGRRPRGGKPKVDGAKVAAKEMAKPPRAAAAKEAKPAKEAKEPKGDAGGGGAARGARAGRGAKAKKAVAK